MERISYTDSRCGWYCTANANSMDLFPQELQTLAKVTDDGKVALVSTWHDTYGILVADCNDNLKITIDRMVDEQSEQELTLVATVNKRDAIHVLFKKKAIIIDRIELPFYLNAKVAWALGAKRYQRAKSMEELDKYFTVHDDEHEEYLATGKIQPGPCYAAMRYNYGRCHAVIITDGYGEPYDGKYFIDGFLTRDEAVEILEKAIQLDGWYFSYPARVQYVLDNI